MPNTTAGGHVFLPWIRQGISTQLTRRDGDGTLGPRATFTVGVSVAPGPLSTAAGPVQVPLAVYGPGDVKTLDARVVTRTWPKPNAPQAEPNYFPLIELDPPDLPWHYTPARANAKDRLRPWLTLIVLADAEVAKYEPPSTAAPNAAVTVASAASLPLLDQSWAWSHVQVSAPDAVDGPTLAAMLTNEPDRLVARLICPRRLDPNNSYTGFLVPALERARLAGLGLPLTDTIDGLAPAWTAGATNVKLPVYYSWSFRTGPDGDFASLVRRIEARVMPPTVGSRPMAVDTPGLSLPAAATTPLAVESALRAVTSQATSWPPSTRSTWTQSLAAILNLPAQRLAQTAVRRLVVPPLYGQWYRATDTLNSTVPTPTPWFEDLNGDPRLRVSAGLGTQVIQRAQQTFLASAWRQVAGVREANTLLRQAQLAREAAGQIYQRDFASLPDDQYVLRTQGVHGRVFGSPTTVRSILAGSVLGIGVMEPSWRRLTRPLGALGKRVTQLGKAPSQSLVSRLNSRPLPGLPPATTPSSLATIGRAGAALVPSSIPNAVLTVLRIAEGPLGLLAAILLLLIGVFTLSPILLPLGIVALAIAVLARLSSVERTVRLGALRDGTLTGADIRQAAIPSGFVPADITSTGAVVPPPSSVTPTQTQAAALAFRDGAARVFDELHAPRKAGRVITHADTKHARAALDRTITPRTSVAAAYQQRVHLAPGVQFTYHTKDPLEPVMAAPTFPDAMSVPLAALSNEWLLSGLDQVPPDTVSLVNTNSRFVEAYMIGLNHEMGRTLLFNQYPTDQRGSYFVQFWKPAPLSATPSGDISPIAGWDAGSLLGSHAPHHATQGADYLVLLLRAELLHRYPNVTVYATKATWQSSGTRAAVDPPVESQPVFFGQLGTGVGYWGFDLTAQQVRGGDQKSGDAGWFFVFQEHPDEARFGLEPTAAAPGPPTSWDVLAWDDLVAPPATASSITYVDLNTALPDTSAVQDPTNARWHADNGTGPTGSRASDLAYITFRNQVRLLVHGSQMVPAP